MNLLKQCRNQGQKSPVSGVFEQRPSEHPLQRDAALSSPPGRQEDNNGWAWGYGVAGHGATEWLGMGLRSGWS